MPVPSVRDLDIHALGGTIVQKRQTLTIGSETFDVTGLSAKTRRILAIGIRGADGDEPTELDVILERVTPELLAEMDASDIANLRSDLESRIAAMPEAASEWTDDHLADARKIKAGLDTIAADETRREAEDATRTAEAQALLDSIRGDAGGDGEGDEGDAAGDGAGEGEGDGSGDGAEGGDGDAGAGDGAGDAADAGDADSDAGDADADAGEGGEVVPIAASAAPRRAVARGANPAQPRRRPAQRDERMVLRASANVPGMAPGQLLTDNRMVAQAFLRAIRATASYDPRRNGPLNVPVMTLGAFDASEVYGDERYLDDSTRDNQRKIDALFDDAGFNVEGRVTSAQKLAASGGICVAPPLQYDQPVIGTNARPVRDTMLVRFGADRGGVRTLPPPHLTDVGGAITVWTEANDQDPSDPATKGCLTLTCPDEEESVVDAIVQCLKIGNYRARNFAEQVNAWTSKVAQQAVRVAETKMLTEIGAGSTQVAVPQVLGSARDTLTMLGRATAQVRNRHRLDPSFPFHFGAPAWFLDHMITDLAREQPGATAERLATSDAEIQGFIAAREINASWFLDGETGQVYGAQVDGDLLGWKSHVVGYLYPEGQWLALDGGGIDFGITRDSILNSTNDFIMMSEIFEATHQIRLADSYRIDMDICANGATGGPVDLADVCAGTS